MTKDICFCINCGKPAPHIYQRYCSTVLKLTECQNCGELVDKYVEFDAVLVILHLILQHMTAYRHILLNSEIKNYWRLATIFLLCDAYNKWIEQRTLDFPSDSLLIFDLEWRFYICLLMSAFEMTTFVLIILILRSLFGYKTALASNIRVVSRTLAGFYGNVLVVLAIVWQLHQNWSYIVMLQAFLFLSHVQVQRAISVDSSIWPSVAVVLMATCSKKFLCIIRRL